MIILYVKMSFSPHKWILQGANLKKNTQVGKLFVVMKPCMFQKVHIYISEEKIQVS